MNVHRNNFHYPLGESLLNTPSEGIYSLGFNHGVILDFLSTFVTITLAISSYVVVVKALKGFKAFNPGEHASYLTCCDKLIKLHRLRAYTV